MVAIGIFLVVVVVTAVAHKLAVPLLEGPARRGGRGRGRSGLEAAPRRRRAQPGGGGGPAEGAAVAGRAVLAGFAAGAGATT